MQEKDNYLKINSNNLDDKFLFTESALLLKGSKARPCRILIPFVFNEEMARISAMIMDGSVDRNLRSVMFCQKKDKNKVDEFAFLISKLFGVRTSIRENATTGTKIVTSSYTTLAHFFYYCLGIHKSDESARIPWWIWKSPENVIREYIRYAFAMEGSVSDSTKGGEVRFHTVDLLYVEDLQRLLREKFEIQSSIQKYYVNDYGWKYYLCITRQNDLKRFGDLGFALDTHEQRLQKAISSFKAEAWQITLVKLLDLPRKRFTLTQARQIFPHLCKRAVHHRLTDLVKLGYLEKKSPGYAFTQDGDDVAQWLSRFIEDATLRTKPRKNEHLVFSHLQKQGSSCISGTAREIGINRQTARASLQRLEAQGRIRLEGTDKFQRKLYAVQNA